MVSLRRLKSRDCGVPWPDDVEVDLVLVRDDIARILCGEKEAVDTGGRLRGISLPARASDIMGDGGIGRVRFGGGIIQHVPPTGTSPGLTRG